LGHHCTGGAAILGKSLALFDTDALAARPRQLGPRWRRRIGIVFFRIFRFA